MITESSLTLFGVPSLPTQPSNCQHVDKPKALEQNGSATLPIPDRHAIRVNRVVEGAK
jgi:hypothetical protein